MYTRTDPRLTRRWVLATALPVAAALMLFWLSLVVDVAARGLCFALALTFTVVACTVGPMVYWAARTRLLAEATEDDVSDLRYRLRRLETQDTGELSAAGYIPAQPPGVGLRLVYPGEE